MPLRSNISDIRPSRGLVKYCALSIHFSLMNWRPEICSRQYHGDLWLIKGTYLSEHSLCGFPDTFTYSGVRNALEATTLDLGNLASVVRDLLRGSVGLGLVLTLMLMQASAPCSCPSSLGSRCAWTLIFYVSFVQMRVRGT